MHQLVLSCLHLVQLRHKSNLAPKATLCPKQLNHQSNQFIKSKQCTNLATKQLRTWNTKCNQCHNAPTFSTQSNSEPEAPIKVGCTNFGATQNPKQLSNQSKPSTKYNSDTKATWQVGCNANQTKKQLSTQSNLVPKATKTPKQHSTQSNIAPKAT